MKAIIVHRWDGRPNSDWYAWLKKELERKGFEVIVPLMPNTSEPKMKDWVSHLKKTVGKIDKDTYVIGHSIGCQTIMRYIETLPKNIKIGGIVFVAGWFHLKNLEDKEVKELARPWLTKKINFSKVKEKTNKITVFLSTNDFYGCVKENQREFKTKLNAKVVIEKNKGHFTKDDGVTKIPEVVKEIERMVEMKTKLKFRKAKNGDGKAYLEFWNEGIRRKFFVYNGGNQIRKIEEIKKLNKKYKQSDKNNFTILAINQDQKIVGCCSAFGKAKGRTRHRVELGWLVHPDYAGQGIATQLLKKMIQELKKNKISKIEAQVAIKNTASLKLAKRFGFKIEGRKKRGFLLDDGTYVDKYMFGKII